MIIKERVTELAVLGGPPAFEEQLHVGKPHIPDRAALLERFAEVLERGWLTNAGPNENELQARLAERVGVKHCICMANGTLALEIAIRASGLSGEVIVPSFTFVATAHALQWQQITPVFCDIDPRTHNIDPAKIEALITPRTSAIIGVHLWGRPCEIAPLTNIARRYDLKLLFDAAHAFGCTYRGQSVGTFGDAEVFSFHATKFFTTLEGGAVATNDDELANRIRLMKNFGFTGYDEVHHVGTNGKMNEISAATGLVSLEHLEATLEANRRSYLAYREALRDIPGIRTLEHDERERSNYQYLVIEVDETVAGVTRDELMAALHAENVLARRYFYPGCHRMEPYSSHFPHARLLLPETEALARRVLCLPTGVNMDGGSIEAVGAVIRLAVTHQDELRKRKIDLQIFRRPRFGDTGVRGY